MTHSHLEKQLFICVFILTVIGIAGALIYTKPVLMPFVFAMFYFFASLPIVEFFERKLKAPSGAAFALTFLIIGGISAFLFIQISLSLRSFVEDTGAYKQSFFQFMDQSVTLLGAWGLEFQYPALRDLLASVPLRSYAGQLAGGTMSFLASSFLIMTIYFFLMMGRTKTPKRSNSLYFQIEEKVSSYIILKLSLSALTGCLVGIILFAFGIELAVVFGILAALLNFIPSVGSIIATLLPIPVIALQLGFGWQLIVILTLCSLVQIIIGNVIDPKLVGKDLDLHPIVIILSLVFWGLIWGVGGMFLAVPLTAIVKLILARIDATYRLSEALAGRIYKT